MQYLIFIFFYILYPANSYTKEIEGSKKASLDFGYSFEKIDDSSLKMMNFGITQTLTSQFFYKGYFSYGYHSNDRPDIIYFKHHRFYCTASLGFYFNKLFRYSLAIGTRSKIKKSVFTVNDKVYSINEIEFPFLLSLSLEYAFTNFLTFNISAESEYNLINQDKKSYYYTYFFSFLI